MDSELVGIGGVYEWCDLLEVLWDFILGLLRLFDLLRGGKFSGVLYF
jgi:hypothetical protein